MNKLLNIILAAIITFCCLMLLERAYASQPKFESIIGIPKIIDGDTIEINNEKIRLACVDTPESNYRGKTQYCLDNETNCGLLAKQALAKEIGNSKVICFYNVDNKRDVYGRILGYCSKNNLYHNFEMEGVGELNYFLIQFGYAWYYNGGKWCNIYKSPFLEAKQEGYGLFNEEFGGFKEPKLWRKTRSND